jgi:uncharacterized membrane protein
MNEISPRSTSNRFGLTIFVSIIVLGIGALLAYYFIDERVISWISSRDLDSFTGAKLIKILGKVCVPLWLLFLWLSKKQVTNSSGRFAVHAAGTGNCRAG